MRVYLVRHGDAVSELEARARPLSPEGRDEVRRVGRFLAERKVRVEEIWHSGKRRAVETAELLAEALAGPTPAVRDGLLPGDPPGRLAEALAGTPHDLMVVGHLPFLALATSALLTGSAEGMLVSLPTAGVICLEYAGNERWALRWMIRPKLAG